MTINPAFEEDKQKDGENVYANPGVFISRCSKVRPYFVTYLSLLSKSSDFKFVIKIRKSLIWFIMGFFYECWNII